MEKLFISALPFRITEEDLSKLLSQFGEVSSVSITADWENATFEPYANAMVSNADATIAGLDGYIINSTYLRVNRLVEIQ